MPGDVIERYIHDVLNARAALARQQSEESSRLARDIIKDITLYFADHVDEVRAARVRIASRPDGESRAMLAYVDELLQSFAQAERAAAAALRRARRP